MCVAAIHWQPSSDLKLVLLHNRDEYHNRSTKPASPRTISNHLVMHGTDELAGGTWLAAADDGRLALVMNYRAGAPRAGKSSRGDLPIKFMDAPAASELSPFVGTLQQTAAEYAPFVLLFGSASSGFAWYDSVHAFTASLAPGIHTMSNHGVDRGWPKERRLSAGLAEALAAVKSHSPEAW
jgi:uncharacterized protein with NRDE domain